MRQVSLQMCQEMHGLEPITEEIQTRNQARARFAAASYSATAAVCRGKILLYCKGIIIAVSINYAAKTPATVQSATVANTAANTLSAMGSHMAATAACATSCIWY